MMNKLKGHFVIGAFAFCAVFATPALPDFFTSTNSLILEKYVNPRNIDLKKWSFMLQQKAFTHCKITCDDDGLEQILVDEVRRIGDPYFYIQNPISKRIQDAYQIGDARQMSSFGFILESDANDIIVRYVAPETPAAAVFKIGDRISSVSGIEEQNTSRAIALAERLKQRLEFHFIQNGQMKTSTISPSVFDWQNYYEFLENKILVFHLASVFGNADRMIHDTIQNFKKEGLKGIILDLRFRSGGLPFTAINIAGAFTPFVGSIFCNIRRECIDYYFNNGSTKYFNGETQEKSTEYFEKPEKWEGSLIVLTSKYTFSAGENLANILQSIKRAKVLGEISAGGAGVTGNEFEVRSLEKSLSKTMIFIPEYRQFDFTTKVARPLKVTPDKLVPVDLEKLKAGRDNQLEAAIEELGIK